MSPACERFTRSTGEEDGFKRTEAAVQHAEAIPTEPIPQARGPEVQLELPTPGDERHRILEGGDHQRRADQDVGAGLSKFPNGHRRTLEIWKVRHQIPDQGV